MLVSEALRRLKLATSVGSAMMTVSNGTSMPVNLLSLPENSPFVTISAVRDAHVFFKADSPCPPLITLTTAGAHSSLQKIAKAQTFKYTSGVGGKGYIFWKYVFTYFQPLPLPYTHQSPLALPSASKPKGTIHPGTIAPQLIRASCPEFPGKAIRAFVSLRVEISNGRLS